MRNTEACSDYELIYMIQQGDESSISLLLDKYERKIAAIIRSACTYRFLLRHHEADLFQIASQALLKAVFEFRPELGISFATFSSRVMRNAVIDYQRAQIRKDPTLQADALYLDAPCGSENGETRLVDVIAAPRVEEDGAFQIYLASLEWMQKELKSCLRPQEYQIYRLRQQGYSYPEIARLTHTNRKKVENTLAKARRLLRGMR